MSSCSRQVLALVKLPLVVKTVPFIFQFILGNTYSLAFMHGGISSANMPKIKKLRSCILVFRKKSNKSYTHVLCLYLFYRTKEERGGLACCQLIIKEFFFLDHAKSLLVLVLYSTRIKICVQHTGEALQGVCRFTIKFEPSPAVTEGKLSYYLLQPVGDNPGFAPACTHTSTSCLMTASSSDTWVLRK